MTKPGVNWKDIERRYKSEVLHGDLSVRQLAKDGGVSHVTLLRRAERQGWKPGSLTAARKAISTTNTAEIFAKPRSELTKGEKRQVTFGNACPENPVDARLEVAEIHRRVIAAGGPALLFTNVKDKRLSLVTNLFGTARRAELAFGRRPLRLIRRMAELAETLLPPTARKLWQARRNIRLIKILPDPRCCLDGKPGRATFHSAVAEGSDLAVGVIAEVG